MNFIAPPSPAPRSVAALDLLLTQRSLQPHLIDQERTVGRLAGTCRALHDHHPMAGRPLKMGIAYLDGMYGADTHKRGGYRTRLRKLHEETLHGPLLPLLEDCRDIIWKADALLKKGPERGKISALPPQRHEMCLAYLWAVRHRSTLEQGAAEVHKLRAIGAAKTSLVMFSLHTGYFLETVSNLGIPAAFLILSACIVEGEVKRSRGLYEPSDPYEPFLRVFSPQLFILALLFAGTVGNIGGALTADHRKREGKRRGGNDASLWTSFDKRQAHFCYRTVRAPLPSRAHPLGF